VIAAMFCVLSAQSVHTGALLQGPVPPLPVRVTRNLGTRVWATPQVRAQPFSTVTVR